MANKTIPQLPEQTGKTDNDLLAIVDSGETVTSKIKVSTLLAGVGGTSYFSADTQNTTNITEINRGTTFNYCSVSPTLLDSSFVAGGLNNTIRAGFSGCANAATAPLNRFTMIGGNGNTMGTYQGFNSSDAFMIGGANNSASYGYDNSGIVGGNSNSISYGDDSLIAGGHNNGLAQRDIFIGGGFSNDIQNNNSGMVAGYDNYLRSQRSFIGGGTLHNIQAYGNNNNGIIGGNSHDVDAVNNTFIGGGDTHILRTADRSAIIGGQNHTLSGHTNSVIIGGSGFTSNHNDEVIVPALTIGNYASLNFADDSAAATGGVPLGGVYHNAGALRVRIT